MLSNLKLALVSFVFDDHLWKYSQNIQSELTCTVVEHITTGLIILLLSQIYPTLILDKTSRSYRY